MNNNILDNRGKYLGLHEHKSSLDIAELSRAILQRHYNLSNNTIDRIYRGLFVYSIGLHSILSELTRHCAQGPILIGRFWQGYLKLIETADKSSYDV